MTLAERLSESCCAAFTGIYVRSHRARRRDRRDRPPLPRPGLVAGHLGRRPRPGARRPGRRAGVVPGAADPLAAVRSLAALATPDGTAILVLRNFHRFLGSAEVVQALDSQVVAGKQARTFVVILAPVVQVPVELEKLFVVVEHDLPGRDQLEAIARGVATEPGELPEGDGLAAVLDAAAGLTRIEAENAFSLSLVRHGRLAPEVLWEIKAGMLKKSGLLTLHRGGETFADLGGLEALKSFCSRALRPGRPEGVRARGVLLLGPPGSGKSAFCKALGCRDGAADAGPRRRRAARARSWARPRRTSARRCGWSTRWRRAWSWSTRSRRRWPASSGPAGDSGVSARLFGTLLSWLNDRTSDSFVVCTTNDISRLPPEFARCGAVRRDVLPRPARAAREAGDLADVPREVSASTPPGRSPRTATGRRPRSRRAAGWRRCSTSRWSRRRRTSCRWP